MKTMKYIKLTPETMTDEYIGFGVTIGLTTPTSSTYSGVIKSYDDKHLHISVGGKLKKFAYDYRDIALKVYQFDLGIHLVPESEMVEQTPPTAIDDKKPKKSKPVSSKPQPETIVWS